MIQNGSLVFVGILLMTVTGCHGFNGGSWTDVSLDAGIKFVQVAVGNEKTVVARDASGEVYELHDGKWEHLGGGRARWIAAGGDGSIFAVGKETGKLYRRSADAWDTVPGIEKLSSVVVLDQSRMWGILKTKGGSEVWQLEGGKWARPLGANGKIPAANWRNIAVAPGVFLVTDMSGNVMMRSSKVSPLVVRTTAGKAALKKSAKKKKAAKNKKNASNKKSKKSAKKIAKKSPKKGTKKASKKVIVKKKSKAQTKKKNAASKKSKKTSGKKSASKKSAIGKKGTTSKKGAARKKSAGKKSARKRSAKKKAAA